MTTISTLSLTSTMRYSVSQAQAALTQTQTEISSGVRADLGLSLGARTGSTLSMESEVDTLQTYTASNSSTNTRLSATANALDTMLSSAQKLQSDLITASSTGGLTSGLAASAKGALQSLVAGLNTNVGGQSVFAGINSGVTPVADYFSATTSSSKAAVDDAFQQAFPGMTQTDANASSITGAQMQSFLAGGFSDLFNDSGWQSTWSSASSQTISSAVSPSQTLSTSVSANQGAFQQIAQAYTMLTEFTGSNFSDDAKNAVVSKATALLNSGIAALTDVQAGVGVTQSSVSTANTQISAQVDVLKSNVSDLTGVDTYALSSKMTALQTQLEASYELTSQLKSLSLVNYLTG